MVTNEEVMRRIRATISDLVEGFISGAEDKAKDIAAEAIRYASSHLPQIDPAYMVLYRPVNWHLINNPTSFITTEYNGRYDNSFYTFRDGPTLTKNVLKEVDGEIKSVEVKLTREETIDQFTDEIIRQYKNHLKCLYTGSQTMEAYRSNVQMTPKPRPKIQPRILEKPTYAEPVLQAI